MYHRKLSLKSLRIILRFPFSHKGVVACLFFLLLTVYLPAQTRQQLERKRTELEREIQASTEKLGNIQKDKHSKLEQYVGIKARVEKRRKLLTTFQQEIDLLDSLSLASQSSIDSLLVIREKIKKQYASLLQTAYRMKTGESTWQFIFSASSFNDAYKRWQYLQQYKSAIRQHAAALKETQQKLQAQQSKIEEQRSSKVQLLTTQQQQYQAIEKDLKQTNLLIKKLDNNEKKLAANLEKQKKAFRQLNAAIEKAIQREIELQKVKAPQKSTVEKEKEVSTNNGFAASKGQLPWPVSGGKVISNFGRHPHPKIKSVEIINNGIDLKAKNGASVKCIYEGKVVSTQRVPGYKNTVIIRHANYYTVYSNMAKISVRRGDLIASGQSIGRLGSDGNLHFEIWHNKERVNPVRWIR